MAINVEPGEQPEDVFEHILGDVLERLVATKCSMMLLLDIPNLVLWADILIFVVGDGRRRYLFQGFNAAHMGLCLLITRSGFRFDLELRCEI